MSTSNTFKFSDSTWASSTTDAALSEKDQKELTIAETASITSDTTLGGASEFIFNPTKSLHIVAQGIGSFRRPGPCSELQINIVNPDSTIAYQSVRPQMWKGNCVLSDAEGRELIATEYFFGPGRDPIIHIIDTVNSQIKTVSKWFSRTHTFPLPDGRTFTWEYRREMGFGDDGKKGTALVLTLEGRRVAALIRNKKTRTPGTKPCYSGNGGELLLGEEINGKEGISEELVVATCILMLKKEIDRNRAA
ncbi:hypothetical protein BU24DRAFT_423484 [Aaosphaeria arxii CBS 175.79]|uniref:Uncharacterized protein n=1 Tax=Aaosphaeria arxii CBS 175.79 TaxID=1450172 RepID=A0A6A5XNU5_9PLEO|nr:uncharacterized protein BU24DRAFT_423484 [Aaosphaeria arxii CBS 175.79]KAF2014576.1 hypothetical protein BU24DRAFT_423484 [Aaosphaeria arxii CBS 175.79]